MASRLNPKHDQRTREKIQTSQLINRLTKFVNGEVEMQPAQVTAALGLLKKTLPDLASVEHSGELATSYVMRAPMPAATADEWSNQHKPTLQ